MLSVCVFATTLALGQSAFEYEVGDRVVAVQEAAIVHEGRTVDQVGLGFVLRIAAVEPDRLRVSAGHPGWIDRQAVVPLEWAPQYFSEALMLEADNPELYRARGQAWHALENYGFAIADFSEDARLRPGTYAFKLRGAAWYMAGEYDRALADFDLAAQQSRLGPTTRALRALALSAKGERAKALDEANTAVRDAPEMAYVYSIRAEIWRAEREYRHAIADCDRALRRDPMDLDALRVRAYAHEECGHPAQAIAGYTEVLRRAPADRRANWRRGFAWANIGEYDRALADLNRAAEIDPHDVITFLARSSVRQAKGDALGAAADYLAILRLDPRALSLWTEYRLPPHGSSTAKTGKTWSFDSVRATYMFDGYCPVTLVDEHRWQLGAPAIVAHYRGCRYRFSTRENRERFLAAPDRYAPAASGCDLAILADEGRFVAGERRHYVFVGRKIMLFNSEITLKRFAVNPSYYSQTLYGEAYQFD